MIKCALDIDDVLANSIETILKILNCKKKIDKIDEYYYLTQKYGQKFWAAFEFAWQNPHFIKLIEPESPQYILNIMKYYDINYVTKRSKFLYNATKRWLSENNFPDLPLILYDTIEEKCKNGYNVIIDDCPDIIALLKKDQKLFFFDQPWNRSICVIMKDNITRIRSLKEILNFLQEENNSQRRGVNNAV